MRGQPRRRELDCFHYFVFAKERNEGKGKRFVLLNEGRTRDQTLRKRLGNINMEKYCRETDGDMQKQREKHRWRQAKTRPDK